MTIKRMKIHSVISNWRTKITNSAIEKIEYIKTFHVEYYQYISVVTTALEFQNSKEHVHFVLCI